MPIAALKKDLARCDICKDRFKATHSNHAPRPVVWFEKSARLLVAGQAPGARVHESGKPFTDPSGDRLRDWMGVTESEFYDVTRIAILPMAFCFPGYNDKGSDLPPPPQCAKTWRAPILAQLPNIRLTLLIGSYAQKYHLGKTATTVTNTVANWRDHGPDIIPLPHPSWRNTAWIKRNPWFEADLLPALKSRVKEALAL
ncbi:uracil-DNA glycosylase family protein [uncultured Litoreibacter sp.]|uniref:uracil-DNA glycosylase family protein n=1 Tax=uncultured Litoreibacter sp. TaxID=1392394 RepID=UPI002617E30D|nr:uracil-DNA glycosylase family protein [uncultured Litoreibacter sp.]